MGTKQNAESKTHGRVYTPKYIVNNILDLIGYTNENILKKHIIDNSCGDGAFLCEVVERYCKKYIDEKETSEHLKEDLETYIHGIELDSEESEKCILNLEKIALKYKVNDIKWDVSCNDTLTVKKYNGKMDYVVGNPPYIRVHNLGDSYNNIKKYSFAQNGMTDLYIVFFEIGIKMLNDNGKLGYITPSSYFNSVAGQYMRSFFVKENLIEKIVDLKHFQAFSATTYTAITILNKKKIDNNIQYFEFDIENLNPYFIDTLSCKDIYISNCFYFSKRDNLNILKKIFFNMGNSDIFVKNGFATLCDKVFILESKLKSKYIIPVIKASTGMKKQIIYPYDKNGKIISENILQKDNKLYSYLLNNKSQLCERSIEKSKNCSWYAFGRSQAINDTYKSKISINTLLRDVSDLKIIDCPVGTGVYSGLYIISPTIEISKIKDAIVSQEFIDYVSLLGKYKSGGYYTFSSKDIKKYLDFVFAYEGGLFNE